MSRTTPGWIDAFVALLDVAAVPAGTLEGVEIWDGPPAKGGMADPSKYVVVLRVDGTSEFEAVGANLEDEDYIVVGEIRGTSALEGRPGIKAARLSAAAIVDAVDNILKANRGIAGAFWNRFDALDWDQGISEAGNARVCIVTFGIRVKARTT